MSWFNITDEEIKINHKDILEAIDEVMKENPNVTTINEITARVIKKGIYIANDLIVECLVEKVLLKRDPNPFISIIKSVESPHGGEKVLVEEMKKCQKNLQQIEKELKKSFVFTDESYDVSLHDGRVRIKSLYRGGYVSDIYLPLDVFEAICRWDYEKLNL